MNQKNNLITLLVILNFPGTLGITLIAPYSLFDFWTIILIFRCTLRALQPAPHTRISYFPHPQREWNNFGINGSKFALYTVRGDSTKLTRVICVFVWIGIVYKRYANQYVLLNNPFQFIDLLTPSDTMNKDIELKTDDAAPFSGSVWWFYRRASITAHCPIRT